MAGRISPEQAAGASESEIISVYPHRWTMPRDEWSRLFAEADEEVDILVNAALFPAEDAGILRLLKDKARDGVQIRMLFGDPDGEAVGQRGADEGVGTSVATLIRNVLKLFAPVLNSENAEVRLHGTILYNSIFRADDDMIVSPQIYGMTADNAPALRLRRVAGGSLVSTYVESFERVWQGTRPLQEES